MVNHGRFCCLPSVQHYNHAQYGRSCVSSVSQCIYVALSTYCTLPLMRYTGSWVLISFYTSTASVDRSYLRLSDKKTVFSFVPFIPIPFRSVPGFIPSHFTISLKYHIGYQPYLPKISVLDVGNVTNVYQ